jgi:amino acid permease
MKRIFYAIATLSGTIIGVGFFSLPYILFKVGFWVMLAYFLILGILVILVHLLFGELSLATPDFKRLPGFAKFYLGNWGKIIALISAIFGFYGVLLAYLIIGGQFLTNLLLPTFGGSNIVYTLFYFLAGAIFIYFGIRPISQIEFFDALLFFAILLFILLLGFSYFKTENLFVSFEKNSLFLPYGPILFSLWGAAIIPEIEEMLKEEKKKLKKVILISILLCALFYFLFAVLVSGICGIKTSKDALSGLKEILGTQVLNLFYLFGVFATFTSFVSLGLTLKKTFWYDLKINKNLALMIALLPPLFFFFFGFKEYITVISLVGAITLAIDGSLILLMYKKIRPKAFFIFPLILIFLAGIFYQIIYFLK